MTDAYASQISSNLSNIDSKLGNIEHQLRLLTIALKELVQAAHVLAAKK